MFDRNKKAYKRSSCYVKQVNAGHDIKNNNQRHIIKENYAIFELSGNSYRSKEMMKKIIKAILCSYLSFCSIQILCFITAYTLLPSAVIEQINNAQYAYGIIVELLILLFIIGWINTVFLYFLYVTGINDKIFSAKSYVIESFLYYILNLAIGFIIGLIPTETKFYYHDIIINGSIISKNAYTLKFYYTAEAQIIYVYVILLLFYVARRMVKRLHD